MGPALRLATLAGGVLTLGAAAPPAVPVPAAGVLPGAAVAAQASNTPYDGRFTFIRLKYSVGGFGDFGREAPWAHDYPRAETHLMRILAEFTLLAPRIDGSNILAMDDPELFKHPFAYISEPGFWTQTDEQAGVMRDWLLKGGFLIVDDFRGNDIRNFETEIRRVLPGTQLLPMDVAHPVFHTFFEIETLDFTAPTFRRYTPAFFGVFLNNDRTDRLLAVVNYNNDIGDYWEFSDEGWMPVEASNEAYKLGVNYVMYSVTH